MNLSHTPPPPGRIADASDEDYKSLPGGSADQQDEEVIPRVFQFIHYGKFIEVLSSFIHYAKFRMCRSLY